MYMYVHVHAKCILIKQAAAAPTAAMLICNQAYSDMPMAGDITFNSSTLNAIQKAIVQTQVPSCFILFFIYCIFISLYKYLFK